MLLLLLYIVLLGRPNISVGTKLVNVLGLVLVVRSMGKRCPHRYNAEFDNNIQKMQYFNMIQYAAVELYRYPPTKT